MIAETNRVIKHHVYHNDNDRCIQDIRGRWYEITQTNSGLPIIKEYFQKPERFKKSDLLTQDEIKSLGLEPIYHDDLDLSNFIDGSSSLSEIEDRLMEKFQHVRKLRYEGWKLLGQIFNDKGELEGKCALGVLACESPDESVHLNMSHKVVGHADGLLETYDIEPMGNMIYLSYPDEDVEGFTILDKETVTQVNMAIGQIIVRLNDSWGLTFKEIADFLETTFDL